MEQPLVCTLLQLYHVVQAMLWWPHWCTLWSPLCWIHSSTAWVTETLVRPWSTYPIKQP
jgi:hypothetical protein